MFATKINMDTELLSKKKKGLSTVIATVLIILLVVVSVTIVWTFVKNFVITQQEKTGCFDVESSDKVLLNGYYTCYNTTAADNEVQFSISLKDVEIDSLIVSIAMDGTSRSFTLTNTDANYADLRPLTGEFGDPVKLPGKNEGKTYSAKGNFTGTKVDSIQIAPVVEGKQCGATSQTYQVINCMALAD